MVKKKNKKIVLGISILVGILLFLNFTGFFSVISNNTAWVDKESRATWDGDWKLNLPVTNAFDENWGTVTALHGAYKEANIYEYSNLNYPLDAMVDYLEFEVMYSIGLVLDVKDAYASIRYYVWNYKTSSWDKVYEDFQDSGGRAKRLFFKVSAVDHIQNNEVRLRIHATVGFLQAVFVYESRVRLRYSFEVDCNLDNIKCGGVDNKEYFTCSVDNTWENKGVTLDQCGIRCISSSDCSQDFKCSNNKCIPDLKSYYRFSENQCNLVSLSPSEKTLNDYDTIIECEKKIIKKQTYFRFQDEMCTEISIFSSEAKDSDYSTLEECEVNLPKKDYLLWIIGGVMIVIGLVWFFVFRKIRRKI